MQNRSIKIPASNRQILNLAFGVRYNISFFQICKPLKSLSSLM